MQIWWEWIVLKKGWKSTITKDFRCLKSTNHHKQHVGGDMFLANIMTVVYYYSQLVLCTQEKKMNNNDKSYRIAILLCKCLKPRAKLVKNPPNIPTSSEMCSEKVQVTCSDVSPWESASWKRSRDETMSKQEFERTPTPHVWFTHATMQFVTYHN